MKRRLFVKASIMTGSVSAVANIAAQAATTAENKKLKQQVYELRTYILKDARQQSLVEHYYETAAIPALNRHGVSPVGIFKDQQPDAQTKLYVLVPYASVNNYMDVSRKLDTDSVYLDAAKAYLQAPASAPAYDRIESSLMISFEGMPQLVVPEQKQRIFELRRYESASEAAGKKKIDMFNNVGEIEIFKRVGLTPVFFGETLIGSFRPNLTYMLTFDDMEEHDRNWKQFGLDPEWNRIKAIPGYEDANLVSKITRNFLVPLSFSQI